MPTDPTPTPPASPDRITEAIAKLGGAEKARANLAHRRGKWEKPTAAESEVHAILDLALAALDAHTAPAPEGNRLLTNLAVCGFCREIHASSNDMVLCLELSREHMLTCSAARAAMATRCPKCGADSETAAARMCAAEPQPEPHTKAQCPGQVDCDIHDKPEPAAAPAPDARDDEAWIAEWRAAAGRYLAEVWHYIGKGKGFCVDNLPQGIPTQGRRMLDEGAALMLEFAARPKVVTRRTVTQTGEHFCQTQCKERERMRKELDATKKEAVACERDRCVQADEIADLRQKLTAAEADRNAVAVEELTEVAHQAEAIGVSWTGLGIYIAQRIGVLGTPHPTPAAEEPAAAAPGADCGAAVLRAFLQFGQDIPRGGAYLDHVVATICRRELARKGAK